jgi:protein Tex
MNDPILTIAKQLNIPVEQATAAVELLDADNSVPFVARYRKEATGGLDEEQLRLIAGRLAKIRALNERRETVLKTVEEQGNLTPELRHTLLAAATMTELEDLYLPYRPKRRTRASAAREKGLQPLADLILEQVRSEKTVHELAAPYLSDEVQSAQDAWVGACDIVAETISDNAEVRQVTRQKAMQWGWLRSERINNSQDERQVYSGYYEFEQGVDRLRLHQVLAINRGEADKVLRVKINVPERDWREAIQRVFRPVRGSPLAAYLDSSIDDAAERLLLPAIERDVRRELSERAEIHAIAVFSDNLRSLLNQPPLSGYVVMGIDPGYRTGCKVAVVDATGKVMDTTTIYPHQPQKEWQRSLETLESLAVQYRISLVAIGNGTASRESEALIAELIQNMVSTGNELLEVGGLHYLIVNEAGASVYSASPLGRAELPNLDVSMRGAVSIARRVQDPLAELVKIDPKSIGVGLYQHDIDQKRLNESLSGVVESVVNQVGVDVNTASPALLTYISGIGPKLAQQIVNYRDEQGPFTERNDLLKVPGLGPKAFEQSAGFLRIRAGKNLLDASAIHPESYAVATEVLKRAGLSTEQPSEERGEALDALLARTSLETLAAELDTGVPTLRDILVQLVRPGRDPRQDLPAPVLRSDVLSMEDLTVGMRLKGTVRNVVDFGAFVDIGVKQDGLLHRSQIPQGTALSVGQVIEVEVLFVEIERGRIGLRLGRGE